METRSQKCPSNMFVLKNSRKYTRTGAVGKKGIPFIVFFIFLRAAGGAIHFFSVQIVNTATKNQLVRRQTFDVDKNSAHRQPAGCRARPTSLDDDLEDITWIHGLEGESVPAASYGILPNLKKNPIVFAIRDGTIIVGSFLSFYFLFFLVLRKIHGKSKKMRWVLLSPGITCREVATLIHLIESSKPAARA